MKYMHKSRKINAVCYVSITALGVYLSVYQNALPQITAEYGLSGTVSGLMVALHFIAAFLFPFVLGALADRIGRKPVITVCFGMVILGVAIITLFGNVFTCSFGIFIIGGGFCVIEGSMSSLLSESNPEDETRVMNISQMYFCFGAVIGPLLGTAFTSIFGSWKSTYVFVMAIFLICALLTAVTDIPKPAASASAPDEKSYMKAILKKKYFLFLMAAMFLYVGIEEGAAFWTNEFVESMFGASAMPALYLSGYWLGMGAGRLAASFIKNRFMQIFTLAGLIISIPAFGAMFFFKSEIMILIMFVIVGFAIAPVWPLIMASATTAFPDMPDTAAGGVMSAGSVGAASVPFILGACSDAAGIRLSFAVLFVLLAALTAVQFLSAKVKRPIRQESLKNQARS